MVKRSREDSPPSSPSTPISPSSAVLRSSSPSPHSVETPAHSSKYLQVTPERSRAAVMKCSLPPHHETLAFSTFEEFEIHYSKFHANRCSECRRNFPTEHFLGLHIEENHDPLNEARRAKGEKTVWHILYADWSFYQRADHFPQYRCFVEDCDKVCSTTHKRRMHLIDKHIFPKNYDFLIVNTGVDKRSSMLRSRHRRPSSAASRALARDQQSSIGTKSPEPIREVATNNPRDKLMMPISSRQEPVESSEVADVDIEDLSTTMSALQFVPPSVRFGRGGRRGGLSRS